MTALPTTQEHQHWNDTIANTENGSNQLLLDTHSGSLPQPSTEEGTNHWKSAPAAGTAAASATTATTTTTTTLGDIMGLVTESESLEAHYSISHPLDRMALTANGNLQRLVSSFYDAPVSVVVDYCVARDEEELPRNEQDIIHNENEPTRTALRTWDRRVSLQIFGQTFCVATSVIRVHDPQCVAWVESGQVGLGQLFRHLNVLPTFMLQRAGLRRQHEAPASNSGGGGGFWREYSLECAQLSCDIHEEFVSGLWMLSPKQSQNTETDENDEPLP